RVARDPSVRVERAAETDRRVADCQALIARYVADYEAYVKQPNGTPPVFVYGVTTGFGEFKNKAIDPADLRMLQRNLLLSHSVGVGTNSDPNDRSNFFPAEVVRAALVTRLNA